MTWSILRLSIPVIAIFWLAVAKLLAGRLFFESHRPHIAGTFVACGILVGIAGRFLGRRRQNALTGEHASIPVGFDLRFWGPMLVILGALTLDIEAFSTMKEMLHVPAPARKHVEVKAEPVAVVFPRLKMQGVILRESGAIAIIDGNSYQAGDDVQGATIVQVTGDSVTLRMSGQLKVLSLGTPLSMDATASAKR